MDFCSSWIRKVFVEKPLQSAAKYKISLQNSQFLHNAFKYKNKYKFGLVERSLQIEISVLALVRMCVVTY